MLAGFKKFIMQGNVVDLAVGVVIGAAFGKIVTAFVEGIINPLIGIVMPDSAKDLNLAHVTINGAKFMWGSVLSNLITFLATAAAVYFFVVVPVNKAKDRRAKDATAEPTHEEKVEALLQQIASKN
jgi:large conductance mechanosensitive channel